MSLKDHLIRGAGIGLASLLVVRRSAAAAKSGLMGGSASREPVLNEQQNPEAVSGEQPHRGARDPSRKSSRGSIVGYAKDTLRQFIDDDCPTMAAALAYYTTFSLPPILLIVISVAGLVFGREAVQGKLQEQIQGLVGSGVEGQVQAMVQHASQSQSAGFVGMIFGILVLVFGATTTFAQLQAALNKAWQVKPDPEAGGWKNFLTKRVLSLGMVLGIGFLLLVSLALSAALSAFGGAIGGMMPQAFSGAVLQAMNLAMSFAMITALFAAMFKVLPDAKIHWREAWVGAVVTAALFTIGKFLIGLYLGKSGAANAFGVAGSLVLIILWVYYASMILLLGAEFTQVWAEAHGRPIEPEEGAVRVVEEEKHVRSGGE
jgi:membrane protein